MAWAGITACVGAMLLAGCGVAAPRTSISTQTQTITVQDLTCSTNPVAPPATDACTVTLSAAATAALTVNLTSDNAAVQVPTTVTIPAGSASAQFTATVTPVSQAAAVGLTASYDGSDAGFTMELATAAGGALTVGATSIGFGDVMLNLPATQSLTLTSSGTAAVTVSSATLAGTGFSLEGPAFPVTLSPGTSTTLNLEFDPNGLGPVSGTLTIASNGTSGGTASVALTGTGVAPDGGHLVDLTWNPPSGTADPITGYAIYRTTAGGTAALLDSIVGSETSYLDTTVQSGETYQYYVESVDGAGNHSAPSNLYTVTIP